MAAIDFDKIKQDFINADVDEKIRIYIECAFMRAYTA